MFNLFKVLVVIAALVCIAAANPSIVGPGIVGPGIVPGIGAGLVVGAVGPVGPIVGVGHGGVIGHPHILG